MRILSQFNNPWDQGKSNKGEKIEEVLKKSQEKFMNMLNKRSGGSGGQEGGNNHPTSKLLTMVIGGVIALWLTTGFYTIQPDEEGVVLRFGSYTRTVSPGLNYKFPDPIESVTKVSVTRINREEIGFRSRVSNGGRFYESNDNSSQNVPQESQMLTGDENIIDIDFDVQWKINDAKKFLFNVRDLPGENTVKTAAESAMRETIGVAKITDALAEERYNIEQKTKKLLQDILNSYDIGIEVVRLQMLRVEPPPEVIDAYRDVQSARADSEQTINKALAHRNDVVPRASGEAAEIIQGAEGYKSQVLAQAKGDAARFVAVYEQYKNNKEATRKRIYLETMQQVMQDTKKVIIDNKNGTVPIVGINELLAKRAPTVKGDSVDNGDKKE